MQAVDLSALRILHPDAGGLVRHPKVIQENPGRIAVREQQPTKATWIALSVTDRNHGIAIVTGNFHAPIGLPVERPLNLRKNLTDTLISDATDHDKLSGAAGPKVHPETPGRNRALWRFDFPHAFITGLDFTFVTFTRPAWNRDCRTTRQIGRQHWRSTGSDQAQRHDSCDHVHRHLTLDMPDFRRCRLIYTRKTFQLLIAHVGQIRSVES